MGVDSLEADAFLGKGSDYCVLGGVLCALQVRWWRTCSTKFYDYHSWLGSKEDIPRSVLVSLRWRGRLAVFLICKYLSFKVHRFQPEICPELAWAVFISPKNTSAYEFCVLMV